MRQVTLKLFPYHLDLRHLHQSSRYNLGVGPKGPPYHFDRALGPVSFVDPQDIGQGCAAPALALALSQEMAGPIQD
jgi:hypothetical protein